VHPRIREVLEHLDTSHALLQQRLGTVPARDRATLPVDGSWSVAEVLAHLALVDARIARTMVRLIGEARAAGAGPDPAIEAIIPGADADRWTDRSASMPAPAPTMPAQGVDADTALAEFESAHATLRSAFASGDGIDLSQLVVPHPLFGPMNLYQLAAFAGSHEVRHAAQIDAIASTLPGA
jgi:hypothetical protein